MSRTERLELRHLTAADGDLVRQAADLLVRGFAANRPNAWPTMGSALEEVRESLEADRVCRVALDGKPDILLTKRVGRGPTGEQ